MPQHDEYAAVKYRFRRPEYPVRQPTANNSGHIHKRAVNGHNGESHALLHAESALTQFVVHIINQNRFHSIVGETLPKLREEQGKQSLGMPKKSSLRNALHNLLLV
ncbi:hypothetical protein D3C81_1040700 [compost metagenome]